MVGEGLADGGLVRGEGTVFFGTRIAPLSAGII
jgi:hypothetical protein